MAVDLPGYRAAGIESWGGLDYGRVRENERTLVKKSKRSPRTNRGNSGFISTAITWASGNFSALSIALPCPGSSSTSSNIFSYMDEDVGVI